MFVRAVYTERTDMEKARTDALYDALKEKGYPDDFCREIAYKQMNTDYTATRMLGYDVSCVASASPTVSVTWYSCSFTFRELHP